MIDRQVEMVIREDCLEIGLAAWVVPLLVGDAGTSNFKIKIMNKKVILN